MSTISARTALSLGQCSAPCLVAYPDTACDCRCGGAYHGALADVELEAKPPRPGLCSALAPDRDRYGREVRCEYPPHQPVLLYEHHNGEHGMWHEPVVELGEERDPWPVSAPITRVDQVELRRFLDQMFPARR